MPWPDFRLPPNSIINTASIESCNVLNSAGASAAYPAANLAIYVPFRVAEPIETSVLFWYNGATLGSFVDMAIMDTDFNRIVHTGATLQSGTNTIQSASVTKTRIGPGLFFFGIVLDLDGGSASGTGTLFRAALAAELMAAIGCFQEALGQNTLKSVGTPAHVANAYYPAMGLLVFPRTVI